MLEKRKSVLGAVMVFGLILALRLLYITNPPFDYSSWRQTDTDSIARNFAEYRFNIFYPQLNYDGPMPNYTQLELQVTTYITAVLYRLFGFSPVLGRMVPILFFMGSCIYLYALVKRISGPGIALMSVLSYGLLPLNIIYSRNIMPESALMFFTLGALYHFTRWVQNGSTAHYAASLLLTVLTAMTKLPSVLIGIPMIYLAFKKWGLGSFKKIKLILFPAVVFSLTYAYMAWLGNIAEHRFVSGIGLSMILPNFYSAIFKYENIKYLLVQFAAKIFTLPGIALFAFGLWISYRRADHMYYFWLLSAFLHIVLIDAVIHLDYYLMYITPIVSVFIGAALNRLLSAGKYRLAFWGALMLVAASSTAFLVPAYSLNRDYITYGRDISGVVPYNELIITDTGSPELLYASGRKGWRLHGDLLTGENIENRKALGASYFAPVKPGAHPDIEKILNSKYEKILFPDGYYIYRLK